MAAVYKAHDINLERSVAIKVIRKENFTPAALDQVLKRFEREAKSLAQLSHPNIVKVIDFGEFDHAPYLVLEFLSGGTLRQHLVKALPYASAAQFIIPVTKALAYAHQRNIIHRDIKPSNILLTDSGEPMLADFGIAKILAGDEAGTLTDSGIIIGTPEYIAPEQGLGNPVDARTDVYALGVVLYEIITGRKPFQADTPMGIVLKHVSEPPPPPRQLVPRLPKEAEQVMLKALAKNPLERYQDMNAFTAALSVLAARGPANQNAFSPAFAQSQTLVASKKPADQTEEKPLQEDTPRLVARIARLEKVIADALREGDIDDAQELLGTLENLGERGKQAARHYRDQLSYGQLGLGQKEQPEIAETIKGIETCLLQGDVQQAEAELARLEKTASSPAAELQRLRQELEQTKQKLTVQSPGIEPLKQSQNLEGEPTRDSNPALATLQAGEAPAGAASRPTSYSEAADFKTSKSGTLATPQQERSRRGLVLWGGLSLLILGGLVAAFIFLPRMLAPGVAQAPVSQQPGGLAVESATPPATPLQAAAGAAASTTPTDTPLPSATATTPASATPSLTSMPTSTPTASASPEPSYLVRINRETVNIRTGPGTVYKVITRLSLNDTLVASGRNQNGDWLVVTLADGDQGWVSTTVIEFNFDPAQLPVVAAPPTPVIILPSSTSEGGSSGPPPSGGPTPTWTPPPP